MKNRKIILVLALLAMACLIVAMVPTGAQAQEVNCQDVIAAGSSSQNDFDGDGLNDYLECTGVNYLDGTRIESCVDNNALDPQTARERCFVPELRKDMVDPETKDIFVRLLPSEPYDGRTSYIVNADGSYKFDPLIFVKNSIANGGLGLTVHLIEPPQADIDRNFTPDQGCYTKAVKVTEKLAYNTVNGVTTFGTPLDPDDTTIYTRSIVDLVEGEANSSGLGPIEPSIVWTEYIRHTFAHEIGHTLTEYEPESRKDGNHLPGGSEFVMERFVAYKYSKKDEYTTFYTGRVFSPDAQAGLEFYEW